MKSALFISLLEHVPFSKSVDLVFLDPQYEKVANVFHTNYPLYPQSDYQIMRIIEQVGRY